MSQRKRQMATSKRTDSGDTLKRWLRLSALVVGIGAITVSAFMFSQPVFDWLKSKAVNSQVASSVNNSANDQLDKSQTENKLTDNNAQQAETVKSWRVAFQNAPDFVTEESLERYIKAEIDDSFFTLDVAEVSEVILTYPWVKQVKARKVWPHTLMLDVEEHQPWLNLNNEQLISKEGIVFQADNINQFDQLPLLTGSYGKISDLLSMYHFFSEQMPENEFRITELSVSPHNGWTMQLENGIVLFLGNKELSDRLERFLTVIESINQQQKQRLAYIDMRYQSGVAVGWKNKNKEQVAQH